MTDPTRYQPPSDGPRRVVPPVRDDDRFIQPTARWRWWLTALIPLAVLLLLWIVAALLW